MIIHYHFVVTNNTNKVNDCVLIKETRLEVDGKLRRKVKQMLSWWGDWCWNTECQKQLYYKQLYKPLYLNKGKEIRSQSGDTIGIAAALHVLTNLG